jgi:hypothetical protein
MAGGITTQAAQSAPGPASRACVKGTTTPFAPLDVLWLADFTYVPTWSSDSL